MDVWIRSIDVGWGLFRKSYALFSTFILELAAFFRIEMLLTSTNNGNFVTRKMVIHFANESEIC